MNRQPTITKTTFDQLLTWEKALIEEVVEALNEAQTLAEVNSMLLSQERSRAAPPSPIDPLLNRKADFAAELFGALAPKLVTPGIEQEIKRAGETRIKTQAHIKAQVDRYINGLMQQGWDDLRASLPEFIRTGKLSDSAREMLVSLYDEEVIDQRRVEPIDGRLQFVHPVQFRSGLGAVAYGVILLSHLGSTEPVLLICEKCQKLKLIEPTGGDKSSRFCSTKCRVNFHVQKHRAAKKAGSTRKHR